MPLGIDRAAAIYDKRPEPQTRLGAGKGGIFTMKIELILIRHGATIGNAERRYIGQRSNQPLSERGAKELLERKTRGLYPSVEALYVSPLARCVETARLIYPMLVPSFLPSLAEMDFGSFEGKNYEQLKDDPAYRQWIDTAGETAPPGGESGQEFAQRLLGAVRQIAGDARARAFHSAAVVTHGGCIMTMIAKLHPLAESGVDRYDYQAVNGGGYRVSLDTETLRFDKISPL